jgi:NmrA-like family
MPLSVKFQAKCAPITNHRLRITSSRKSFPSAVSVTPRELRRRRFTPMLPDVEAISGGKFDVPRFTGKARIDRIVKEAGFAHHTFVIALFYYQNLVGVLGPQKQADGSVGWALPLDPGVRCIHMGDITELGNIVAGAFAHPLQAGNGEHLPLVGDFMSFNEIIDTLNRQGHKFSFKQVPKEVFAPLFPGGAEVATTFSYWQAYTYLGSDSYDRIALANKIAGGLPTKFSAWAQVNFLVQAA